MNTRTKTNLYITEGIDALVDIVSSCYKNGTIGIIYEDKEEENYKTISKAFLRQGNKIKSSNLSELNSYTFEEHIRYYIGIGGRKIIKILQSNVKDNKYAFYCTEISPDFFTNGLLMNERNINFAEFAYYDSLKNSIKDTKTISKGYCTITSLLVSLLDLYCMEMVFPYKDVELEVLIKKLKDFLLKPVDSEQFFSVMLELVKNSMDYINTKKIQPLIYRIREKAKGVWSAEKEFFINYLLFYLGIIFTKWNINDMLIPAATQGEDENIIINVLLNQSQKIADFMLKREELNHISMIFRALGNSFETIDVYENLGLIIENSPECRGLFRVINNMGVIERIIDYEEHKRY